MAVSIISPHGVPSRTEEADTLSQLSHLTHVLLAPSHRLSAAAGDAASGLKPFATDCEAMSGKSAFITRPCSPASLRDGWAGLARQWLCAMADIPKRHGHRRRWTKVSFVSGRTARLCMRWAGTGTVYAVAATGGDPRRAVDASMSMMDRGCQSKADLSKAEAGSSRHSTSKIIRSTSPARARRPPMGTYSIGPGLAQPISSINFLFPSVQRPSVGRAAARSLVPTSQPGAVRPRLTHSSSPVGISLRRGGAGLASVTQPCLISTSTIQPCRPPAADCVVLGMPSSAVRSGRL